MTGSDSDIKKYESGILELNSPSLNQLENVELQSPTLDNNGQTSKINPNMMNNFMGSSTSKNKIVNPSYLPQC